MIDVRTIAAMVAAAATAVAATPADQAVFCVLAVDDAADAAAPLTPGNEDEPALDLLELAAARTQSGLDVAIGLSRVAAPEQTFPPTGLAYSTMFDLEGIAMNVVVERFLGDETPETRLLADFGDGWDTVATELAVTTSDTTIIVSIPSSTLRSVVRLGDVATISDVRAETSQMVGSTWQYDDSPAVHTKFRADRAFGPGTRITEGGCDAA